MSKRTPPQDAYFFRAQSVAIINQGDKDGGTRKFSGIAYTGKPLRHPFWENVAFDLSSTTAADPTPVLVEHDRAQRAGFATLDITEEQIGIAAGVLLANATGQSVAADSDAGFPWQLSVHIEPGSVERLEPGQKASVNGHELTGPAHIFRNNLIREVSFTPTGVDHQTSAAAMSAGGHHPAKEDHIMPTVEELQAQVNELKASIDAITARAETAEQALETQRTEARMSAVKALFSDTGREYSEEAGKPYMEMSETTFAAVSADLRKAKPAAPEHLFRSHADNGTDHEDKSKKFSMKPSDIYAQRRAS